LCASNSSLLAEYQRFEGLFFADLQVGIFDILALQENHFVLAEKLIRKHGQHRDCHAADALHLAVAISIQRAGELADFVSADKALASLAAAEGLAVNNPEA
jgi:predicted nucleic acid-binding protein